MIQVQTGADELTAQAIEGSDIECATKLNGRIITTDQIRSILFHYAYLEEPILRGFRELSESKETFGASFYICDFQHSSMG